MVADLALVSALRAGKNIKITGDTRPYRVISYTNKKLERRDGKGTQSD